MCLSKSEEFFDCWILSTTLRIDSHIGHTRKRHQNTSIEVDFVKFNINTVTRCQIYESSSQDIVQDIAESHSLDSVDISEPNSVDNTLWKICWILYEQDKNK